MESVILRTDGNGLYRSWQFKGVVREVQVTDMKLGFIDNDEEYGELRVYFNPETYPVKTLGLIYTDERFLLELRRLLRLHCFNADDVGYSEQGMQGRDFVSLDIGKKFIKSLREKTSNLEEWSFAAVAKAD